MQTIQAHTVGIVWPGCIEPAATHTTKSRPSLTGSHRPQYQRDEETDRERKEGQRKQSRPSPRSGRGTEKDEARRNEEQPRTRDRCRRPCMICTTDRESWREETRETESWRGRGKREQSKIALFQPLFYASPRTQANRTGNPCRCDRFSVNPWKSPCINSPFVEYAELEAINAHFQPMQTGGRFTFSESSETWKPAFVPPSSPPKKFQHFTPAICPLKNDLFSHCRKFGSKLGFASFIKELFLKNSDLTKLSQECIFEKEKVVHHR